LGETGREIKWEGNCEEGSGEGETVRKGKGKVIERNCEERKLIGRKGN